MRIAGSILFITIIVICISCNRIPRTDPIFSAYVGREKCKACHEEIFALYTGSHHDLAMHTVTEESVLGNFDHFTLIHMGDTARFYRTNGRFFVYTKGVNGIYDDFEVKYTFGWIPLQQYLIEFPGGRYQVLPFCWDSRSYEEGGQRWFHIYNREKIHPDDILFWTGKHQNWNHVCAECHSTDLKKNFSLQKLTYKTSWKEIDISCDACHGPSGNHMKWADLNEKGKITDRYPNKGFAFNFFSDSATWEFDMEKGTAYRSKPRTDHGEVELCVRCHSRRMQIREDYLHGEPLMQTHIPEVLVPRLYHVDGQIKDEDYVYGSFLQSGMYHQGVSCTDCHDPHSLQTKAPANILCVTCHLNERYNTYAHHFHKTDGTGGSCIDCHMPETTYMVVDPRRDHSIRIPRPDLSLKIGTPNACTKCHTDKTDEWAAKWFREWYGDKYDTISHFGEVFYAAMQHDPDALDGLIDIVNDREQPDIVRATAIIYMEFLPSLRAIERIQYAIKDRAPMVRMVAMQVLGRIGGNESLEAAVKLMNDPVRAVRYEAALSYSRVPYTEKAGVLKPDQKKNLDEYINMLMVNADQAAAHVNLGIYYQGENMIDSAFSAYRNALRVDSASIEAVINMADLFRMLNRDEKGEKLLLEYRAKYPNRPELYNALGLLYIREQQPEKALGMFSKSLDLEPENTYYIYVYGVALSSIGERQEAIEVLEKGYEINPYDYSILFTLASIYNEMGDEPNFKKYYDLIVWLQKGLN